MSSSAAREASPSSRLLALDPGDVRIGVAVSDELGLFAHPRDAIDGRDPARAMAAVARIVHEEAVAEVFVGLPLGLNGSFTGQTTRARAFADQLARSLAVPVRTWDERLTTAEAARRRPRGARRDGRLDSAAASVLLQSVLDRRRDRGGP